MEQLDDLIKNPWFALALGLISIIIGIVTSHIYYKKGKKEGDTSSQLYLSQLAQSNNKIGKLEEMLTTFGFNQENLINLYSDHDLIAEKTDEDIMTRFFFLYNGGEIPNATKFLALASKKLSQGNYYYLLAYLNIEKKDFVEALSCLDLAPKSEYTTWYLKGYVYLRGTLNIPYAILCLCEALRLKPDDFESLYLLINAFLENNQLDEAKRRLDAAIELNPQSAKTHDMLARYFVRNKNGTDGLKHAALAIEYGAPEYQIWGLMGDCYSMLSQWEVAIQCFSKVPLADSNHHVCLFNMIGCYRNLNMTLEAYDTLKTYKKYYPDDQGIAQFHILILSQIDPKEAIALKDQYNLFTEPHNHIDAINNLGIAYFHDKQFDQALECYQTVQTFAPNHISSLQNLGLFYSQSSQSNLGKSYYYFNKAYKLSNKPIHPGVLDSLGRIHLLWNEKKEALNFFEEGCNYYPDILHFKKSRDETLEAIKKVENNN